MLGSQQRRDLVRYRIEKAYKSFEEAKGVAKLKFWNLTGNRLYYTVFHMATAKTHAGVIHLVGEKFIATGLLDRTYGKLFSRLYELRQSGDYDDTFDATEEEVLPYFEKVENFVKDMEALITHK